MQDEECPKVFMKVHKARGDTLVAVCDEEVIGRTFSEGHLRIRVSERFYRGTLLEVDDCDTYLREATIANFVGKESVTKAVKLGLVREENVITIQGIPHAQMIKMLL